ncbi:hypothetical protein V2P72_01910 [Mesomycoplasma hyopneumoniae]|uniref:hypothetical protein n=1 Tax=Mesomycoplasma hyopneumoniae TaxID=2099 RepID=UPI003DA366DC
MIHNNISHLHLLALNPLPTTIASAESGFSVDFNRVEIWITTSPQVHQIHFGLYLLL